MADEDQQGEWERTFPCEDATNRERALKMFPNSDGRMVIQAPPPGTAIVTLAQLMKLTRAAAELFPEAQRRGMRLP